MELISATNIQFGIYPAMQVWKGDKLVWSRGLYWTGLGIDNNWSTANNWSELKAPIANSSLTFAGGNRLSAFNDFAIDTQFSKITFFTNAGEFQLSGNRLTIGSGGFLTNSVNKQTINNDVKLSSGVNTINSANGNLTFNGVVSGTGSILKTGNGSANFSVARSIFTGPITINAGTFQYDNLLTNGGYDLAEISSGVVNLSGNEASFNLNAAPTTGGSRIIARNRTINYSNIGNQTFNLSGNVLLNNSVFTTSGGPKNYIVTPVSLATYLNAQFAPITYNVADGPDDVDLEANAYLYNQTIIKTGSGKMSVTQPLGINSSNITISAGTFDIGGNATTGSWTGSMSVSGTFSYSSSSSSNISARVISGTGNIIKSGTSVLTLSSANLSYEGSTSILNGSIVTTRNTATATFTNTTLTVSFSTPPNISDTFRFFSGSTVQSYASVSLIGASGRTASYNSLNSTLTIDS